ncbi:MAG TPA: nucleotidyltransferase family protein [Casimicrobiaceae bacterium]|nr:nucleotidyltransferase family protein [Casimicrobiaceae bacterium]
MSRERIDPLLGLLRDPSAAARFQLADWDALIRSARRANLLPRVALDLDERGLTGLVPEAPRAHLEAARVLAAAQAAAVRREVAFIDRALADRGVPIVLLKGAAYLIAGLSAARGRMFSDVDILVPAETLADIEAKLMLHGWASAKTSAYDQRYYRRWMHELPPLKHHTRQTVLDVHHAILPTAARLKPDSAKLLAAAFPVPGEPRLRVLAPVDMVLHSATHLFCNEDVGNSLRDLVDLDSLLRELAVRQGFWEILAGRAAELDLARPLYYALRYARGVLDTPVPDTAIRAADAGRPPPWLRGLMDGLFLRTLHPRHADRALTSLARLSLYVRAHWLRMPPLLLAQHLAVKAFRREESVG